MAAAALRPASDPATEPQPDDPLDPHAVLDDEERRLLEADDATLSHEERFARADAQRKLVMADPEHPLRPVLERVDAQMASGEYAQMARDMYSGRTAFPDRDEAPTSSP